MNEAERARRHHINLVRQFHAERVEIIENLCDQVKRDIQKYRMSEDVSFELIMIQTELQELLKTIKP